MYENTYADREETMENEYLLGDIIKDTYKRNNVVLSGFEDLDGIIGGFIEGEFIIVGSRPSIGKTAFALSLINNITINNRINTCYFSLEMRPITICEKLLGENKNIDQKLYDAPLYIIDSINITIEDLKNKIEYMVDKYKTKLVFIDYLGLMCYDHSEELRDKQVAKICKILKSLSLKLKISIIALAQLSRDAEGMIPDDLKYFLQIENDADIIMFLHRDRNINGKTKVETDLIILQNRINGQLGKVKINFLPNRQKFER
jgi:replicative DNA helicase